MSILSFLAGALMLLPQGLYNVPTHEQTQETVVFHQEEVVQELPEEPDYSEPWLDGRVSLNGGELTTSKRQYLYAEATGIPVVLTSNYNQLRNAGHLVRLSGPHIGFTEVFNRGNSVAYVLSSTLTFFRNLSEAYNAAGCGRLMVNNVLRLDDRRRPRNASPHSVHPRGMAVDLRIIHLSPHCYGVLERLLQAAEANGEADVTLENNPRHFHVVVVPRQTPRLVTLEARYERPTENDQSE